MKGPSMAYCPSAERLDKARRIIAFCSLPTLIAPFARVEKTNWRMASGLIASFAVAYGAAYRKRRGVFQAGQLPLRLN